MSRLVDSCLHTAVDRVLGRHTDIGRVLGWHTVAGRSRVAHTATGCVLGPHTVASRGLGTRTAADRIRGTRTATDCDLGRKCRTRTLGSAAAFGGGFLAPSDYLIALRRVRRSQAHPQPHLFFSSAAFCQSRRLAAGCLASAALSGSLPRTGMTRASRDGLNLAQVEPGGRPRGPEVASQSALALGAEKRSPWAAARLGWDTTRLCPLRTRSKSRA